MKNLDKAMKAKNLSQKEIAFKVGISEARLSHYKKGRRKPDLKTLAEIAKVLDVTVDYLLDNENTKLNTKNNIKQLTNEELKQLIFDIINTLIERQNK